MTARASPPALLSDDRFTCTVQVLPATNSLPVTGELDFATAPLLLDAAELIRTAPARDLTVHLHAVSFEPATTPA